MKFNSGYWKLQDFKSLRGANEGVFRVYAIYVRRTFLDISSWRIRVMDWIMYGMGCLLGWNFLGGKGGKT